MNYKKVFLIIASVVILGGLAVAAYFSKSSVVNIATPTQKEETKQLSNIDEVTLQRQLQEIVTKGKETDCSLLNDSRYQFACHDFFKIQKK